MPPLLLDSNLPPLGSLYKEVPDFDLLPHTIRVLLLQNICINSSYASQISSNGNGSRSYLGNRIECGLLSFVARLGQDYKRIRQQFPEDRFVKVRPSPVVRRDTSVALLQVFTFNSSRKYMATIIPIDYESGTTYRVLVKGASEMLLDKCVGTLDSRGEMHSFSAEERERVKTEVIEPMSSAALRTLCLAYK